MSRIVFPPRETNRERLRFFVWGLPAFTVLWALDAALTVVDWLARAFKRIGDRGNSRWLRIAEWFVVKVGGHVADDPPLEPIEELGPSSSVPPAQVEVVEP